VIKDENGTLIFFNTGKFRVMGCIDAVDASFLAFKYIMKIGEDDIPDIQSQSYTSHAHLGYSVNIYKLSKCDGTIYEANLFCAIRMTKYNPVSVNVFSTGSIVFCGLREAEDIHIILNEVDALCKSINM
jgi:TATA-box binding protein (TBP) (component of TFIID and TFIIIB)